MQEKLEKDSFNGTSKKSTMQSKNKENDMTSFLRNIFILNVKKVCFTKSTY